MDPLSQGVLGASFSQSTVEHKKYLGLACLLGFLSGMAPDLDVLIGSSSDPLLGLEYHRQFTHSLLFIPVGGLICAALAKMIFKHKLTFRWAYIYCTVGWATHGLLDACTTYGTLLFWPFSDKRVAWNNVSIIDPLFTLPLLFLMIMSVIKKKKSLAVVASVYSIVYLSLGVFQHQRAVEFVQALAKQRGHEAKDIRLSPSFGNLILWRSTYLHRDNYYVGAVRVAFSNKLYAGETIKKLNKYQDLPWLEHGSVHDQDIERFRWFSNNQLAWSEKFPTMILDVRYAMSPRSIYSLWGLKLFPQRQTEHVQFERLFEKNEQDQKDFWSMLKGH